MDKFTNFITSNYIWFIIFGAVLFFAIIGYVVERKNSKRSSLDIDEDEVKEIKETKIEKKKIEKVDSEEAILEEIKAGLKDKHLGDAVISPKPISKKIDEEKVEPIPVEVDSQPVAVSKEYDNQNTEIMPQIKEEKLSFKERIKKSIGTKEKKEEEIEEPIKKNNNSYDEPLIIDELENQKFNK